MAKHNDREFPEELKRAIREQLKQQFQLGLAEGAYAIGSAVMNIAKEENKSADEKVRAIISFCEPVAKSVEAKPGGAEGS